MPDFDVITIGGGLGGSAFSGAMARNGLNVLLLERETKFKDRVRGEGMPPWGAADARELGVLDLLRSTCAHDVPRWQDYVGPMQATDRDLPSTTTSGLPNVTFYHPAMQTTLLDAAADAGAEVRAGARATGVTCGATPAVTFEQDGKRETKTARLVVVADGRNSPTRAWAGFGEKQDASRLFISGVLFENYCGPDDTSRFVSDFEHARSSIIFPQGKGRARSYLITRVVEGIRLQGTKDVPGYVDAILEVGMPREFFERAEAAGPLATFEGADCYVEHPYRDGVALIGDAAASSDPSWGQGLALTVRDARVLRDSLLATDDWDAAGHAYAAEHDRYFGVVHTMEDWLTELFYSVGPEADATREKALGAAAEDPTRQPDVLFSGPDEALTPAMRSRFFGD